MVEQRHVAEEISGAKRGQNRFPISEHGACTQFARQNQKHGIALLSLFDDDRPLQHALEFHVIEQMFELRVI